MAHLAVTATRVMELKLAKSEVAGQAQRPIAMMAIPVQMTPAIW